MSPTEIVSGFASKYFTFYNVTDSIRDLSRTANSRPINSALH